MEELLLAVLYRDRNAIERMLCRLKDFLRFAKPYDRNAVNVLAAVCIAATVSYWLLVRILRYPGREPTLKPQI